MHTRWVRICGWLGVAVVAGSCNLNPQGEDPGLSGAEPLLPSSPGADMNGADGELQGDDGAPGTAATCRPLESGPGDAGTPDLDAGAEPGDAAADCPPPGNRIPL